jgi:hypothetical protein
MKKLILTVSLFCGMTLNAQVKHLDGFTKYKTGHYKTTLTEEEAIRIYSEVMDANGIDTLQSNFTRNDNPVVFSYFKFDEKPKKVNVGFIVKYEEKYDIWFTTIKDEDTFFFTVKDKNGEEIDLIYEKPKE